MIHFRTEPQPGEPDILAPLKDATLVITDTDHSPIYFSTPPDDGWTHELLVAKAESLTRLTAAGAHAYLGRHIVGSTED